MHAVLLDLETISNDDVDLGALTGAVDRLTCHGVTAPDDVAPRIAAADVVIVNKVALDAAAITSAKVLKLVCLAATGTNNVDLECARARGVAVANIRGYCTQAVVQHVFGLVLSLTQHLQQYQQLLYDGAWKDSPQFCLLNFSIRELAGKTIGIVGFGELGRAVAGVAEAFGMNVLVAERRGQAPRAGRVPLEQLLAAADIVSLHCPLTPQTQGLIGAAELAAMKDDALLINTARGGLVDAQALHDALHAGTIGGAGIDVLEREPPVEGNVLLEAPHPRLIVTPHIAWATREARQRAITEIAANIAAFRSGERRNRVD